MRKSSLILTGIAAALMGGALLVAPGGAMAASESQRICENDLGGTWDKSTKTCVLPVEETKPGNNNGNATWETEETDTAHGTLKNAQSTSEETCTGPGGSTSKC